MKLCQCGNTDAGRFAAFQVEGMHGPIATRRCLDCSRFEEIA